MINNTEDFVEWIDEFYDRSSMENAVHSSAELGVEGDQGIFTAWNNAVDIFLYDLIYCKEIILSESADKKDILRWISDVCS